jgi:hypothetical protein
VPFLYVTLEARGQPRSERHNPTFAEFGFANEQRIAVEIYISQLQPHCFTDAQSKPVEQGENCLVGWCPMRRTRPVRECTRHLKQAFGIIEVEDIRDSFPRIAPGAGVYGITLDQALNNSPVEKAMQYAEQVVVTARPRPRSGLKETFDQDAVYGTPSSDGVFMEIAVKKPQCGSLGPIFPVQGLLVLNKLTDRLSQRALKIRNFHSSSPLPMAASRRAAMATLV